VSVRLPSRTREKEADEVASANYDRLKEEILRAVAGKLRSQGITTINRQDLEASYSAGWQGVTQHIIQGRPVTSLEGLLHRMTHRRAIDLYRYREERRRVDVDLDRHGVDPDVADQLDDQEKLTRLLSRLKDRLSDKERRGVTLCVLHGYTRPEAADLLGIDHVVFERIMDSATKKMSGIVASIEARGCGGEEWSRMMRAYALGLLAEDEPDYRRAKEHVEGLDGCPACRRYVRGLRGLAAVLPPLLPPGVLEGHDAGSVLANLNTWLSTGHASVAVKGAGAAGTVGGGSGAASIVIGGGTATKALVLAGAAALSIAGAAALATHRAAKSQQPGRPAATSTLLPASPVRALSSNVQVRTRPVARAHHTGRTAHRGLRTRVSATASQRRSVRVAHREAAPEFGFEVPATEPARVPPATAAPARPAAHVAPPVSHGESDQEFGFEN
jgi:DNA-directed RNA polymerase specialized sigma24 family protein